ncbi:Phenylalanyl-tRNA synthetase B3/B4 [Penicillium fimorum]|uniref:Phenylalanyl-tRNA synthetase B3/B4 n=1 Tax=Penicillium fimorum TaxID=1882269 RepID=A0A9W9XXX2_9EURO|nr:Phenylalanyl-tRNA synthetase B3/B4 [Penicillium fimorum]
MSGTQEAQKLLKNAHVAPEIFELRPDYRALLMVVEGIPTGPSDDFSEALLSEAENSAKDKLSHCPVTEIPHIAAWREAYKAFGAKPQKTRNSLEALTREDLDKYDGSPVLVRATGNEEFETFSGGKPQTEHAAPGEPVWRDDSGITCRRWNWRQGPRTALTDDTSRVLFILDALEPLTDDVLTQAADELASALKSLSPEVQAVHRIIGPSV